MSKKYNSESGQAIVLLVISLVVLLGFTALALDGGMVYSDRRLAQNIADTSALAGGGVAASGLVELNLMYQDFMEYCSDGILDPVLGQAVEAAELRAETNYQALEIVEFDALATCGEDLDSKQRYIEVHTTLTANTPTSFAHLLFSGPLRSRVEAITKVYPIVPFYEGHAIVSLNNSCEPFEVDGKSFDVGGISVLGGGGAPTNINIIGGSIHSNSCVFTNGNTVTDVNNGTIDFVDNFIQVGSSSYITANGEVNPDAAPYPIVDVPPPNCPSALSTTPHHNNNYPESAPLQPGRYAEIRRTGGEMNLAPGLYCVEGDVTININGDAGQYFRGEGVTFYLTNGSFRVAASSSVDISAPTQEDCVHSCPGNAIRGILIYLAPGNNSLVSLLGSADSTYTGTVYAPDGTIEVGGSSSLTDSTEFNTQLIAWNVVVHGGSSINITYDASEQFTQPAKMDLYR